MIWSSSVCWGSTATQWVNPHLCSLQTWSLALLLFWPHVAGAHPIQNLYQHVFIVLFSRLKQPKRTTSDYSQGNHMPCFSILPMSALPRGLCGNFLAPWHILMFPFVLREVRTTELEPWVPLRGQNRFCTDSLPFSVFLQLFSHPCLGTALKYSPHTRF